MNSKFINFIIKIRRKKQISKISNANYVPKSDEGRLYHLGVKRGEVANRILTVGDPERAEELSKLLDKDTPIFRLKSHRGFLTITGKYKGVPISIVAIGMGISMMDFFVREVRSIVDGQMAIIRFGSCGTLHARLGDVIVQSGSFAVMRNYDFFSDTEQDELSTKVDKPYNFTKIFYADQELSKLMESKLLEVLDKDKVITGLNATCDSFYSSQGRHDENFRDCNDDLLKTISEKYPDTISIEMETFMLYHLARSSTSVPLNDPNDSNIVHNNNNNNNSIKAASAAMVFVDRNNNEFVDPKKLQHLRNVGGKAIFETLVEIELIKVRPENDECVWNMKK